MNRTPEAPIEPQINVEFDPSLMHEDVNYRVQIDRIRAYRLLKEYDMPSKHLAEATVKFTRHPSDPENDYTLGNYEFKDHTMIIYTDIHWRDGRKGRNKFNHTFLHEGRHAIDHEEVAKEYSTISDRRFALSMTGTYLPIFSLIGGIALAVQQDQMIATIGGLMTMATFPAMLFSDGIVRAIDYGLNPLEKRARQFANERSAESQWQNIVSIQHKNRLIRTIHGVWDKFLTSN
jgi:hypothetical protein